MPIQLAQRAARIFEYPDVDYLSQLRGFEQATRRFEPAAAAAMAALLAQIGNTSIDELRELYTRTFDLMPVCAPYLSVHLFGEGSFKRAQLMTGLAEWYAEKGIDTGGELPDHLAVVLDAIERLDPVAQRELLHHCLKAALEKMRLELERQENPYAAAMQALERLTALWLENVEVNRD